MAERQAHDGDTELTILDAELRRLTRRADRQRRHIKQSTRTWQRWSTTIDQGLSIVDRIERTPARDLVGLTIVFQAILWRLRTDEDVIMDEAMRRALKRFGRQLSEIAQH